MNPYLHRESPEEDQCKAEFPGPAPMFLFSTIAGTYYQVDMNPQELKLFMWKGKGIMAQKAKVKMLFESWWEEIPVKEIKIPTKLGLPIVFITKSRCEVTTAPLFGRQMMDKINTKMNPREATFSEEFRDGEGECFR